MKDKEKQFKERIDCGIGYCEDMAIEEIKQDFKMQEEKNKQIEEIAKDLKENLRLCAGVKLLDHQVETVAYELSKKYQPKLSEDIVVLSREEYQKDFNDQFNKGYKHGSNETAEKIVQLFKNSADFEPHTDTNFTNVKEAIIDGAHQASAFYIKLLTLIVKGHFGVEIKE